MDANISIVCFKSKVLANGEYPLMLRISQGKLRYFKSLGISIKASCWNFDKEEPKRNYPNREQLLNIMNQTRQEYVNMMFELKALGKVGIIPALFGINEPVLFGTPIVMNPMLAIPFIGMPVIACLIQYFALYTGICPLYGATQIPWTCPPIISGFLLAGWKSALLQLVILCVSFFVYLPFIKKVDKMNLVQEKNQPVEDEDEDW